MERKIGATWVLIAILSFSILSVNWLTLTGTTEFTSGKPERSELIVEIEVDSDTTTCLLYTSPSPRDLSTSRMPSSA